MIRDSILAKVRWLGLPGVIAGIVFAIFFGILAAADFITSYGWMCAKPHGRLGHD